MNETANKIIDKTEGDRTALTVVQTADAFKYFDMLVNTSKTVREFCAKSGSTYECFIGVKRGFYNWQSTYNRIPIFSELYERGCRSWVLYLDADAYIVDLDFDIHSYLETLQSFGAVMTPSGATPEFWDVNAGVLMLNLGHPSGVAILKRWEASFAGVSDEVLKKHEIPFTGPEDQILLHNLLKEDQGLWPDVHLESTELMNSPNASFIRQNLRSLNQDFDSRQLALKEAVDRVFGEVDKQDKTQHEKMISAAYQAVLGRGADKTGLTIYSRALEVHGLERGLREMIKSLIGSLEYQKKGK